VQSEAAATGLEPLSHAAAGYGFNRAYSGVFAHVPPSEASMHCPSPDEPGAPAEPELVVLRLRHESEAYDDEHYAADLVCEDEEIAAALAFEPWWVRTEAAGAGVGAAEDAVRLEKEQLLRLRFREHLLGEGEARTAVSNGLVDLLYAACYDWRTTLGEGTCESAWTVVTLSATLAWLARFEEVPAKEVAVSCVRRCLAYPLYRHWRLALAVLDDVARVLALGAPAVLKCLLRLHALLESAEGEASLLNSLFLEDYLGWAQAGKGAASRQALLALGDAVRAAAVQPADMPAHFCALDSLSAAPEEAALEDSDDESSAGEESSDEDESREEGREGSRFDEAGDGGDGQNEPAPGRAAPLVTELPNAPAQPAADELVAAMARCATADGDGVEV